MHDADTKYMCGVYPFCALPNSRETIFFVNASYAMLQSISVSHLDNNKENAVNFESDN